MLRIGILGAAGIAPNAIITPARRRDDVEIAAVASRSASSADAYATTHSIPRSYAGYDKLLADPEIDLVYNALPPSEHARWSIAALETGKDVLCEKPFAMSAEEARRMTTAASDTGRRLIEAFHDRYHPLSAEIDRIVASGSLGEIVSAHADFTASIPFDPASIRHDPAVGGGSLMDLGCYPVHWLRALMADEPDVLDATATVNSLGADLSMEASLRFPSGATARMTCSMVEGSELNSSLDVVGTLASLHVDNLVFPSKGHFVSETSGGITRNWTVAGLESYDHQLAAVVAGLASGETLPTEGTDPVAQMQAIDAIYTAAGFDRVSPASAH
jgi:predicted dehydrogenase